MVNRGWAKCPTYTIAGMYELYEQLLPRKLYIKEKTQTSTDGDVLCRLCGKVLVGCSSLVQTLREHELVEEVPPCYSPVMPKPA